MTAVTVLLHCAYLWLLFRILRSLHFIETAMGIADKSLDDLKLATEGQDK